LDDFEGRGIALQLGACCDNPLVDLDLDCFEARELADTLLPPTRMVHGRPSCRRSHRWYRAERGDVEGKSTLQFRDPVRKTQKPPPGEDAEHWQMLLEVRASAGHKTTIPPSTRRGEKLHWDPLGEPALVRWDALSRAAHRLAAASLLARYWP